ncbi:MAG: LpqN/LpqT family lipoprotein [Actinobacteria bacterium]|nr:LpqN/LpqT family lipoprotein [Actinomycetota bacterium]
MILLRAAAVSVSIALALTACDAKTPDYKSIWSTTPTTTTTPVDKAGLIPFPDYLNKLGVQSKQVVPDQLTDLKVTLPRPQGWTGYKNLNYSPGTVAIAKNDTYPLAMLMVFQLSGDFDVKDALRHSDADALLSDNFKKLYSSGEDFQGYPSAMIEGSYDLHNRRMQSYNRIVIAQPSPPRPGIHYLIQLTVTTYAEQAKDQAGDIEAIIKGFSVGPK